jgi:Integrase core domain
VGTNPAGPASGRSRVCFLRLRFVTVTVVLGSVRRECLDHLLILHEKQLHRVLQAYVKYFNQARPHQGIQQQVPGGAGITIASDQLGDRIISVPVLGGLHHAYRRSA